MILKESVCFVLKKSLQCSSCQKMKKPQPSLAQKEVWLTSIGRSDRQGDGELGGGGHVAYCMSTMASVFESLALAWSRAGRSGNVLICDEQRPDPCLCQRSAISSPSFAVP